MAADEFDQAAEAVDEVLTGIELAQLIRSIDQRVLQMLYIRLYFIPKLTYDEEGHVKTVTLTWNEFMQLAGPWLKDVPGA